MAPPAFARCGAVAETVEGRFDMADDTGAPSGTLTARLRAVAARARGDWAAGREALDELAAVEQSKARHPSVGYLPDPDGLRLPPAARTVL